MQSKIYNLLINCFEDNLGDKIPDIDFQLFLISVKSLVPYEDKIGCFIDVERYKKELELFKLYKNGEDEVIDNYFINNKLSFKEDNLLESKILPIIITNTIWDILVNEVLKTVTIYSINKSTLLDAIIISSAIDVYLSNNNTDYEMISEITKGRIIDFSLKAFSEKNNIIIEKMSFIEFEKERIKLLTSDILSDRIINRCKSINHILYSKFIESSEDENESVLNSFSAYLYKLRKGIISPDKLKLPQINIPEFKEFLKYSSFTHPLLGKCRVVKRDDKEVIIRNKSGLIKVNI
ncbi:hypothetical protein HZF24_17315 [Sedimentibacter hydroxybenzoicus DSM 7310]|uniref:Uncharacterized protein n=1 Tax=Sedimentibacter hydroxybenzoicus DSM 7310 TaxID=1123245 RepID=A0A974BMQ6_SEDHY|nr:hypothetical protein [Sedimentibacter hydroxybenzoicus]NYB75912.1 hypothetical protein [Sedimentibacter hydroxybenzoicus DSM 7310]